MVKIIKISLLIFFIFAGIYSVHEIYAIYNKAFTIQAYDFEKDLTSKNQNAGTNKEGSAKATDISRQDTRQITQNNSSSHSIDKNPVGMDSDESQQLQTGPGNEDKNPQADGVRENGSTSVSDILPSSVQLPIDAVAAESKAENIAGSDVDVGDYFTVGLIVLNKLSANEISYLFSSAKSDYFLNTPVEEIESTRDILFSKLSASDLATLRALGTKYGYSMKLLDPDIDVAVEKEKLMKRRKRD